MAYSRWWCDTVTVHHKTMADGRSVWTPTTYTGAYFRRPMATAKNTEYDTKSGVAFCRFRAPAPIVSKGDIVTHGENATAINDYIAGERSSDYIAEHEGECFVVDEIRDNTHENTPSPHLYAGGR